MKMLTIIFYLLGEDRGRDRVSYNERNVIIFEINVLNKSNITNKKN